MEELSVTIKICDRQYPMKVRAADEARVRKVGQLINEQVRSYSTQFGIHDKQDLLAMVAFDCLVDKLKAGSEAQDDPQLHQALEAMQQAIDQALT